MTDDPPYSGRGLLLVDEFCLSTGLDLRTVESLMRAGQLEGLFGRYGVAIGLFDDVLPSGEQLRAMGLTVNRDYMPDDLRSCTDDSDDSDPNAAESPTWTMSWPDDGDT